MTTKAKKPLRPVEPSKHPGTLMKKGFIGKATAHRNSGNIVEGHTIKRGEGHVIKRVSGTVKK